MSEVLKQLYEERYTKGIYQCINIFSKGRYTKYSRCGKQSKYECGKL